MAALSGPASTMTVLLGETAADFFTERGVALWQSYGTEDAFQAHERVSGKCCATLEHIVAALALDDDAIAAISGLACLTKAALKFGKRYFHVNQII
jgi:hypothetical protein